MSESSSSNHSNCNCFECNGPVKLTLGTFRNLTKEEKKLYGNGFKYAVVTPFRFECDSYLVEVPVGFLTDGSSRMTPEWGLAWMFHDYLYATHKFSDDTPCTRHQADAIMCKVLEHERIRFYKVIYRLVININPFKVFDRAWKKSGNRGPQFAS